MPVLSYNSRSFKRYCDNLVKQHTIIRQIHVQLGYPPYWKRPNTFASIVKIILEQQVSLASAHATYLKLADAVINVNPLTIQIWGENNLRHLGITKQKAQYIYLLAVHLCNYPDYLTTIESLNNKDVYNMLVSLKGIGSWSANVYMLTVLNRINIYPPYDVALLNGISSALGLSPKMTNSDATIYMQQFAPYQSIAVCYFYWHYINERNIQFIE